MLLMHQRKQKQSVAVKKAQWRGKLYIHCCFNIQKKIIKNIEDENESGEPKYQGKKIKCYTQEKKYLVDNATHIIKSIVECTEEWYSNVCNKDYTRTAENLKYVLSDEGNSLLLDIWHILNSSCRPYSTLV